MILSPAGQINAIGIALVLLGLYSRLLLVALFGLVVSAFAVLYMIGNFMMKINEVCAYE